MWASQLIISQGLSEEAEEDLCEGFGASVGSEVKWRGPLEEAGALAGYLMKATPRS